MKGRVLTVAALALTLQACSLRAITVRTIPEPSPGVFVESCVDNDDCPGSIRKFFLTMGAHRDIEKQGLIDISYYTSDMTGPGSVLRAGSSFGLSYDGNILDCIVLNAGRLEGKAARQLLIEALTIEQEVIDSPDGHLRVTPGEFLRFERQDGIGEEFGRLRDVEIGVDDAVIYKESIDAAAMRKVLPSVMPYLGARCQELISGVGYLVVSSWRIEGLVYRPVKSRLSSPKVTEESIQNFFVFPAHVSYKILEDSGTVQILDKRALFVGDDYIALEDLGRVPIPLREAVRIYSSIFFK